MQVGVARSERECKSNLQRNSANCRRPTHWTAPTNRNQVTTWPLTALPVDGGRDTPPVWSSSAEH